MVKTTETKEVELLKDNVVKKIFSGDTKSSRMLIARVIEEVTDHEFREEDILKSMIIDNSHVSYNIHTVNADVDTLLHTNDIIVNFEYNTSHYRELDIKNNAYICNLVLRQISSYKDYSSVKRVIQINLNNYDLFNDKEFIHASVYMDKKTKRIRPNNISEIYDINLEVLRKIDYNKINKEEDRELKRLLYFLINNNKLVLNSLYRKDKLMEDIMKKIEQVTNDLDYLFYYDKKELERQRDERERREGREEGRAEGLKEGHEKGLKEGLEKGREEGLKKGIEQNTIEIIKSMLENKSNYEFISQVTKKSIEEIKEIEKLI